MNPLFFLVSVAVWWWSSDRRDKRELFNTLRCSSFCSTCLILSYIRTTKIKQHVHSYYRASETASFSLLLLLPHVGSLSLINLHPKSLRRSKIIIATIVGESHFLHLISTWEVKGYQKIPHLLTQGRPREDHHYACTLIRKEFRVKLPIRLLFCCILGTLSIWNYWIWLFLKYSSPIDR